ncbi:MAG: hypothetical protein FWE23_07390 [Chitinivibrionia bacterium]|nr:hypothetical protein [Chitinivibrionia bacterium]
MLTKMNRLSVLLYHGEREKFLQKLRDVGVVHVECGDKELDAHSAEINASIGEIKKVISDIKTSHKDLPQSSNSLENVGDAVKKYIVNMARVDSISNEISSIAKERKRFDPWGDVNPETLETLEDRGIHISLFELSANDKHLLKDIDYETVKETANNLWIAAIGENKEVVIEGRESVRLPDMIFAQLDEQEKKLYSKRETIANEQKEIASKMKAIEQYMTGLQDELNYEIASNSMVATAKEKLLSVVGWIPKEKQTQVQTALDEFSCWYEFEEPTVEDDVPVQFQNNAFAEKYEIITRLFALPKYKEIDPTPFFAPFYMLFFGFCLGDVGYGALILIATIIAYTKVAAQLKPIVILGMMLGFSTMIGGFLLNGFFGMPIFNDASTNLITGEGLGILGGSGIGALSLLKIATVHTSEVLANGEFATKTLMPMIPFSIFLGVFQILFAMMIRAVNRMQQNDWNFQYALLPVGTMFLTVAAALAVTKVNFLDMGSLFEVFFGITAMQMEELITAPMMLIPMGIGLALMFLFNNPQKHVGIRLPLGLWELYQFATGLMGDGLSYIRLFALGLAGGLLGASFNQIAFMVTGGELATPLILVTILILIVGHLLNFGLAALGSFVHPLRLTFVEFYKHIEFQGGAREYKPFAKATVE